MIRSKPKKIVCKLEFIDFNKLPGRCFVLEGITLELINIKCVNAI